MSTPTKYAVHLTREQMAYVRLLLVSEDAARKERKHLPEIDVREALALFDAFKVLS